MASNRGSIGSANRGLLHEVPLDILAVFCLIGVLAVTASSTSGWGHIVRSISGLTLVTFVPGYLFVGALFPRRATGELTGLTGTERLGLAVGSSLAIGVLLSIGLVGSSRPFETTTVLTAFGGVTVGLAVLSTVRRLRVPHQHRVGHSVGEVLDHALGRRGRRGVRSMVTPGRGLSTTHTDRMLNLVIVIVLLAVLGLGVQSVGGESSPGTTELYLLSGESAGDAVAANYPTADGEYANRSLYLNVENHEGDRMEYDLVVRRYSELPPDGTGDVLDRQTLTVEQGERTTVRYDGEIARGGRLLTFSIYRSSVTEDEPYRQVQLDLENGEG